MDKPRRFFALFLAMALCLAGCTEQKTAPVIPPEQQPFLEFSYEAGDEVLVNPLMGFAAEAEYTAETEKCSLVYMEILWSEAEPEQGVYAFDKLAEYFQVEHWKQEGKHAVLRVIMDKPSREDDGHIDIPQWLFDATGDGIFYGYRNRYGYSPDYSNPVVIEAHKQFIRALGKYFGRDTFVSYVELGSLGHWGEWHLYYCDGAMTMPDESTRERYVYPYTDAFPNAKLLMRRPFNTAYRYGYGLYNDVFGDIEESETWLDWIENGGSYRQANEDRGLHAMPNAWKSMPIGGEFTSNREFSQMLGEDLEHTLQILKDSHTTFLGPRYPTATRESTGQGYEDGINQVLRNMGYRYHVSRFTLERTDGAEGATARITLTNLGCAPIYQDFPVCLYVLNQKNEIVRVYESSADLTTLLPGQTQEITVKIAEDYPAMKIAIGAKDPMTGDPSLTFATDVPRINTLSVLADFTPKK